MDTMLEPHVVSLTDFYRIMGSTEHEFTLALRASLDRPKVFLKRAPTEIWINGYLSKGGHAWGANMDIQFCLDPYAAANYVVGYMMKGNQGMSQLMEAACREARAGNMDIKQSMRHVAQKMMRAQEIGSQEAVYRFLQLPFKESTRASVYIDTSP